MTASLTDNANYVDHSGVRHAHLSDQTDGWEWYYDYDLLGWMRAWNTGDRIRFAFYIFYLLCPSNYRDFFPVPPSDSGSDGSNWMDPIALGRRRLPEAAAERQLHQAVPVRANPTFSAYKKSSEGHYENGDTKYEK
jgi:hypothetical protein